MLDSRPVAPPPRWEPVLPGALPALPGWIGPPAPSLGWGLGPWALQGVGGPAEFLELGG